MKRKKIDKKLIIAGILILALGAIGAQYLSIAGTDFKINSVSTSGLDLESGDKDFVPTPTFSCEEGDTIKLTFNCYTRYTGDYWLLLYKDGSCIDMINHEVTTSDTTRYWSETFTLSNPKSGTYEVSLDKTSNPDATQDNPQITSKLFYIDVLPTPTVSTGSISVTTSPTGAKVYLGAVYKGTSPLTISNVNEGFYQIKVTKSGYESETTSAGVTAGQTKYVSISLTPISTDPGDNPYDPGDDPTPSTPVGMLSITSSPSGASVELDGVAVDPTPLFLQDVSVGRHTVSYELNGYSSEQITKEVFEGQVTYADVSLTEIPGTGTGPGTLSISSEPSTAYVYVDNQFKGITPLTLANMDPGTYAVKVEKTGYTTKEVSATVLAGATEQVSVTLQDEGTGDTGGQDIDPSIGVDDVLLVLFCIVIVLGGAFVAFKYKK